MTTNILTPSCIPSLETPVKACLGGGAHLSGPAEGADGRHHVSGLDAPGLPLLVQDVRPLHDLLPVGVEHTLGAGGHSSQRRKEPTMDVLL